MKTNILIGFIAALTILCPAVAVAQINIVVDGIDVHLPDLKNPRDQEHLKARAKQVVKTMNSYITSMTKKMERDGNNEDHPTMDERKTYRKAALTCFLEHGDSITIAGVKTSPALMEITTKKRNGTIDHNTRTVKQYFTNLIKLISGGRYTEVTITSSDIESMNCSNVVQVGNRYQCVVTYTQDFWGKRGEVIAYKDRTVKTIVVWFEVIETNYGKEVVPRLGDTKVNDTE